MRLFVLAAAAALSVSGAFVVGCSSADSGERELYIVDAGSAGDAAVGIDAASDVAPRVDAMPDAGADVVESDAADGGLGEVDAGDGGCFLPTGVYGECITTTACAMMTDHSSTAGYCPGAADIECCSVTPNVDDDPPIPTGWKLMDQSEVTPDMTTWAVDILHDPATYPMFSTATMTFGTLMVLARVEWHPPDFQNSVVHRGVTLYQPA